MKLKNCKIGTAVQSKTTGLTGVVSDIQDDGFDKYVTVDFNVYEGSLTNKCETVPPESLRKVKSLDENGGKERVCIIIDGSGVSVEDALKALCERGYSSEYASFTVAGVLYGEQDGGISHALTFDWHYKYEAQHYRDITNEVGGK